jgi:hypothetical protein
MAVAVLALLGRITLVYAIAYSMTYAVWGYPTDIRRIYWGLFAASVFLVTAAWLIGDLNWLFQILVWSSAVACVLFIAGIAKTYFRRSPHALSEIELYSGLAALGFLVPAYLFLARATKGKRHA